MSTLDLKEYISELTTFHNRNRQGLGKFDIYILHKIGLKKSVSAYQLYSSLKSTKYAIAYKNMHKRIKRFHSNGLIQETKEIDRKHGSIYYRLTSLGILVFLFRFYFDLRSFEIPSKTNCVFEFMKYYKDDGFLQYFIIPYFGIGTLQNLTIESEISDKIKRYIDFCAHGINYVLYEGKLEKKVDELDKKREELSIEIMKNSSNDLVDGEKIQSYKRDITLLSKDMKFRKLVVNSKKTFDNHYNTFMNYSDNK